MKVVIFDVYGTLISTGTGSIDAASSILKKNGSDIEPKEFYAEWKKLHRQRMRLEPFISEQEIFTEDLAKLYSIYKIDGDYENDVKIMLDSLYDRVAYPETAEVLEKLSQKYELIIASNTDTKPLLQNFKFNGFQPEKIFTSESLRLYKPDIRFYERILTECGYLPAEVLFVGDSAEEDIIAPSMAGMQTVFADRQESGENYGQTYTVNDLRELLDILGCR